MSTEYRWIPAGSVPTVALLLTQLLSPREAPEAERVRLLPHARLLVSTVLRYPSETCISGRNHKAACAGCILSFAIHASSARNSDDITCSRERVVRTMT